MDDQDDHAIQVIGAYILSVQGLEFKQNYFSKTHKESRKFLHLPEQLSPAH